MTLHGGNLSVHSEGIGYGSTFTIEIPLCFETNSCVYIEDVKCSSLQIKSSLRADKNISPNMFSNKEMVDMDVINSPYITNNIGIIEEKMRSISILVSTHSTYNDNNNENKKQMETGEDKAKPSTNAVKGLPIHLTDTGTIALNWHEVHATILIAEWSRTKHTYSCNNIFSRNVTLQEQSAYKRHDTKELGIHHTPCVCRYVGRIDSLRYRFLRLSPTMLGKYGKSIFLPLCVKIMVIPRTRITSALGPVTNA
eukprot:gene543-1042_t